MADALPGHWAERLLPAALLPYGRLARLERPIGWWLLLLPCWWSVALAAVQSGSAVPDIWHLILFAVGTVAMRGAGRIVLISSVNQWTPNPGLVAYASAKAGMMQMARVLAAIPRAPGAEVTIECNPDAIDPERLAAYRAAGADRLSFGVQSMSAHVLATLGRTHDPANVERAVADARAAGSPEVLDREASVVDEHAEVPRSDRRIVEHDVFAAQDGNYKGRDMLNAGPCKTGWTYQDTDWANVTLELYANKGKKTLWDSHVYTYGEIFGDPQYSSTAP